MNIVAIKKGLFSLGEGNFTQPTTSQVKNTLKTFTERSGFDCPEGIEDLLLEIGYGVLKRKNKSNIYFFSPADILNMSEEAGLNFFDLKLIPLADLMDNDFICFDLSGKKFVIFNIADEIIVDEKENITDLIG